MWRHGCFGRRRARPPARLGPHFVRRRASKPARALRSLRRPTHQWGLVADVLLGALLRSPARPRHRPSISHVIPLRLVQTLNLYRRNCNVFGVSRKMTAINYVRNVGGGGVVATQGSQPGPAARGCRSLALSARRTGCLKLPSPLLVPAEPRLKPSSPLLVPAEPRLKPPSALRVRNGCFWPSFRAQW